MKLTKQYQYGESLHLVFDTEFNNEQQIKATITDKNNIDERIMNVSGLFEVNVPFPTDRSERILIQLSDSDSVLFKLKVRLPARRADSPNKPDIAVREVIQDKSPSDKPLNVESVDSHEEPPVYATDLVFDMKDLDDLASKILEL